MRCVVFGATGYLGARLVPALLAAGHDVRVMARQPAKLDDVPWREQVEVIDGDAADGERVQRALDGQHVLYYLVHSLLRSDFVDFDARAASIVAGRRSTSRPFAHRLCRRHHPRWAAAVRPLGVARRSWTAASRVRSSDRGAARCGDHRSRLSQL